MNVCALCLTAILGGCASSLNDYSGVSVPSADTKRVYNECSDSFDIDSPDGYDANGQMFSADTVVVADVIAEGDSRDLVGADAAPSLQNGSYATVRILEVLRGDVDSGQTLTLCSTNRLETDENGALYEFGDGYPLLRKGYRAVLFLSSDASHTIKIGDKTAYFYSLFYYADREGRYTPSFALTTWYVCDPSHYPDAQSKTLDELKALLTEPK